MERMADDKEIFPRIALMPRLEALGAKLVDICGCTSSLPKESNLALSTHVREHTDDNQGTLEFPEGFGF